LVLTGLRDNVWPQDNSKMLQRHCEERSDEAIHAEAAAEWIASLRSQ
jgi:hypothetical protein